MSEKKHHTCMKCICENNKIDKGFLLDGVPGHEDHDDPHGQVDARHHNFSGDIARLPQKGITEDNRYYGDDNRTGEAEDVQVVFQKAFPGLHSIPFIKSH